MVHGQKRVKFDREGNDILLEHAFPQKLNCGTQVGKLFVLFIMGRDNNDLHGMLQGTHMADYRSWNYA